MAHLRNPSYLPHLELVADQETWDALLATVQTYLDENRDLSTLDEATVRALDAQLSDDRIWNQISGDMNLLIGPG